MHLGDPQTETAASLALHCEQAMRSAGLHFGHGTDNALDEAAWLVLHVMQQPLDGSFDAWEMPVGAAEAAAIRQLLKQRIESRQPMAYLLGEAWFCGLAFEVSPAVLIPRSPIAELIQRRFRPWLPQSPERVLDLCTGCGCIAVATAIAMPGCRVTASDVSAAALAMARRNIARHGLEDVVELVESDLFEALPGEPYDLIVTNPPYVPVTGRQNLPPEYRAEPLLGLVSGSDGLDFPLRILLDAANYLDAEGVLICEVGESADALEKALPDVPFTWLEFEQGGEGVFTVNRAALVAARPAIQRAMHSRRG